MFHGHDIGSPSSEAKLVMICRHSSDQESMVPSGRFMSQDRAVPVKATGK
jgi:hypothetical protein